MRIATMPVRLRRLLLGSSALTGIALASAAQAGQPGLPTGGVVTAGTATIAQPNASQLNITTGGQRTVIDWQSFSIGSGNKVTIQQPGTNSITVNEVVGQNPSQIFGDLASNGRVVLANPNGIWFGPDSHVDVAGLVASTATLSDASKKAFAAGGHLSLDKAGKANASIQNDGHLTIAGAGLAALVAPGVRNNGVIQATLGTVQLASGTTSTLDFYGDGLVAMAVTAPVAAVAIGPDGKAFKATIENNGKIKAGQVLVTADVVKGVVDNAINMGGVTEAKGVTVSGGDIILDGGDGNVAVAGTLDASSQQAKGGNIAVTGGAVTLASTSTLDVSGATGGGTVQVGGGPHGGGTLKHAASVTVASGAKVKANATKQGDGGTVSVWSDGLTTFNGAISAVGAGTGNGGWVETSGHTLSIATGTVDTSAPGGKVGSWLLDPVDITVQTGGTSFTPGVDDSSTDTSSPTIDPASFENSASDVTLYATHNLSVLSPISMVNSVHLTLVGQNAISIGAAVSVPGTLTLQSSGTVTQSASIQATNLELLGSGGTYTLTNNANNIGTISANTGSLALGNGGNALAIATAGSTAGITLSGTFSLTNLSGALSLETGISVGSGSLDLTNATTGATGIALTFDTTISTVNAPILLTRVNMGDEFTANAGTSTISFTGTGAAVGDTAPLNTLTLIGGSVQLPSLVKSQNAIAIYGAATVTQDTAITSTASRDIYFGGTLDAASSGLNPNVTITSTAGSVEFAGRITPSGGNGLGSLVITSPSIQISTLTTTASNGTYGQYYSGAVTLSQASVLSLGGSDVTFNSTVNGTFGLVIANAGNVVFTGAIGGGGQPLAALVVTGTSIALPGSVTTTDLQTYTGPATISSAATTIAAGGDINFSSDINASTAGLSLTITTPGSLHVGGFIASGDSLNNFTLAQAPGHTTPTVFATGTISYISDLAAGTYNDTDLYSGDNILLSGDATITGSGTISFGIIDGAHALTINNATHGTNFFQSIGANTPLTDLTVTGSSIALPSAVTTTGSQTYNGLIDMVRDSVLTSTATGTAGIFFTGQISDSADNENLTITASSGTVSFSALVGAPNPTNSLTVTAQTIKLGADVTTDGGGQSYTGAIVLTGDVDLSDPGHQITINGTIDGAHALTVDAGSNTVTLQGTIGQTTALSSLTVSGNAIYLPQQIVTTNGQSYQGPVFLASDVNLNAGTGPVDFSSTIGGTQALTVTTSGTIDFGGNVGITSLSSLRATGSTITLAGYVATLGLQSYTGTLNFNGSSAYTTQGGSFSVTGASTLGSGGGVTVDTGGGAITFGTIDGGNSLTLNNGGAITLGGAIGNTTRLSSLSVMGSSIALPGTVKTTSGQTYTGNATVSTATNLDNSSAGAISFTQTLDGTTGSEAVTITTPGTISFGGAVGSAKSLGSLDVTGASAIQVHGNVTTSGAQSYVPSALITLYSPTTTFSGGAMSFGSSVLPNTANTQDLTINASGTVNISGGATLGSSGANFDNISITSGGLINGAPTTFHTGTLSFAFDLSGSVSYDELIADAPITLTADTTINGTGNNSLGTINGPFALTIADGTDAIMFDGAIGAVTPLTSLTVGAAAIRFPNGASVHTDMLQQYNGPVATGAASTFTSDNGNITFASLLDGYNSGEHVTVTAPNGTVTFTGSVGSQESPGSLTVTASLNPASIVFAGGSGYILQTSDASPGQTYNGNISMLGDVQINEGSSPLTVNGKIDGAQTLAINAGTVTLAGSIGSSVPLTSLSDAGSSTTFGSAASLVATTGAQSYGNGPVQVSAPATTFSGGSMSFGFSVVPTGTGTQDLTVLATGTFYLAGGASLGSGGNPFNAISITSNGLVNGAPPTFNDGLLSFAFDLSGTVPYAYLLDDTRITLNDDTTITASGNISLGTIDGAHALTISNSGTTGFGGIVGGSMPLASLDVTSAAISLYATISTQGGQAYHNPVFLQPGSGAILLSADGTGADGTPLIHFFDTVAGPRDLIVSSPAGSVAFDADVGGSNGGAIISLTVNGQATVGGNITAANDITFNDPLSLTGNSILTSNVGGAITLAAVSGSQALTLITDGAVFLTDGHVGSLGAFTIDGTLTLTNDVTITANGECDFTFSGITGAHALTLDTAGSIFFNVNVGDPGTMVGPSGSQVPETPLTSLTVVGGRGGTVFLPSIVHTTGDQTYNEGVEGQFQSTSLIAGGFITLAQGLDGTPSISPDVTITATGTVTIGGDINQGFGVNSLIVDAPVTDLTGPVAVHTTLDQHYTGDVAMDGGSVTLSSDTGNLALDGSILVGPGANGASLTLSAPVATVTIGGTVNGNNNFFLNSLNVTAATYIGPTSGGDVQNYNIQSPPPPPPPCDNNDVSGACSYTQLDLSQPLTLIGDATIMGPGNGVLDFTGTIDGAYNLTITNSGGTVSLRGVIGGGTALASLTVSADGITLATTITTTGVQSYTGPVKVALDSVLAVVSAAGQPGISFSSSIDSADAGSPAALTVSVVGGQAPLTFGDAIGATAPLSKLTLTAGAIDLTSVDLTGTFAAQIYGRGSFVLEPGGHITSTGGLVQVALDTNQSAGQPGDQNVGLSINIGGTITAQGIYLKAVDQNDADFHNPGTIDIFGSLINTETGASTVSDTADIVLYAGVGSIGGSGPTIHIHSGATLSAVTGNIALIADNLLVDTGTNFSSGNGAVILAPATTNGSLNGGAGYADFTGGLGSGSPQILISLENPENPISVTNDPSMQSTTDTAYAIPQGLVQYLSGQVALQIGLTGQAMDTSVSSVAFSGSTTLIGNTVTLTGTNSVAGDLTVMSSSGITLSGTTTTTGAQSYVGAVTLAADTTLSSTGSGLIHFDQTISGMQSLTITDSGGIVVFDNSINIGDGVNPLSLSVSAATISLPVGVTTTGSQTYNGNATIGQPETSYETTENGTITFNGALDLDPGYSGGPADVSILANQNGGGAVVFGGPVGSNLPFRSLNVQANSIALPSAVTTTGNQTYGGAATVSNTLSTFETTFGGTIDFQGTLDLVSGYSGSSAAVTVKAVQNGGGAVTFEQPVGVILSFDDLTVQADEISLPSGVNTNVDQRYTGVSTIAQSTANYVSINGGTIAFNGSLDADSSFQEPVDVSVSAMNGGTVIFGGPVGGSQPLNSLTVQAGTIYLGSVHTNGFQGGSGLGQSYTGAVNLNNVAYLETENQSLVIDGSVDGAQTLTLDAGVASVTVTGAIGLGNFGVPLISFTLMAGEASVGAVKTSGDQTYSGQGTDPTVNGDVTSTAGNLTFGDDVTLTSTLTTISAPNGNITFNGNIFGTTAGAQSLVVSAGGSAEFDNPIGTGSIPLNNFTLNASSLVGSLPAINLANGNTPTINLAQTLSGMVNFDGLNPNAAIILSGDTTIFDTDGSINLTGVINGHYSLTLTDSFAGGTITLTGAVGGSTRLTSLTLSAAGIVLGSAISTTGAQTYSAPVTLSAATTLDSTGTAQIGFAGTIDGNQALTIHNPTGTVSFGAGVGGSTSLASLNVTSAATSLPQSVTTNGAQIYAGAIGATGDLTLTGSSIEVDSGITSPGNVTLTATSLGVTLAGTTDVTGNLAITGAAVTLHGAITADGNILAVANGAGGSVMSDATIAFDGEAPPIGPPTPPANNLTFQASDNGDIVLSGGSITAQSQPGATVDLIVTNGTIDLGTSGGGTVSITAPGGFTASLGNAGRFFEYAGSSITVANGAALVGFNTASQAATTSGTSIYIGGTITAKTGIELAAAGPAVLSGGLSSLTLDATAVIAKTGITTTNSASSADILFYNGPGTGGALTFTEGAQVTAASGNIAFISDNFQIASNTPAASTIATPTGTVIYSVAGTGGNFHGPSLALTGAQAGSGTTVGIGGTGTTIPQSLLTFLAGGGSGPDQNNGTNHALQIGLPGTSNTTSISNSTFQIDTAIYGGGIGGLTVGSGIVADAGLALRSSSQVTLPTSFSTTGVLEIDAPNFTLLSNQTLHSDTGVILSANAGGSAFITINGTITAPEILVLAADPQTGLGGTINLGAAKITNTLVASPTLDTSAFQADTVFYAGPGGSINVSTANVKVNGGVANVAFVADNITLTVGEGTPSSISTNGRIILSPGSTDGDLLTGLTLPDAFTNATFGPTTLIDFAAPGGSSIVGIDVGGTSVAGLQLSQSLINFFSGTGGTGTSPVEKLQIGLVGGTNAMKIEGTLNFPAEVAFYGGTIDVAANAVLTNAGAQSTFEGSLAPARMTFASTQSDAIAATGLTFEAGSSITSAGAVLAESICGIDACFSISPTASFGGSITASQIEYLSAAHSDESIAGDQVNILASSVMTATGDPSLGGIILQTGRGGSLSIAGGAQFNATTTGLSLFTDNLDLGSGKPNFNVGSVLLGTGTNGFATYSSPADFQNGVPETTVPTITLGGSATRPAGTPVGLYVSTQDWQTLVGTSGVTGAIADGTPFAIGDSSAQPASIALAADLTVRQANLTLYTGDFGGPGTLTADNLSVVAANGFTLGTNVALSGVYSQDLPSGGSFIQVAGTSLTAGGGVRIYETQAGPGAIIDIGGTITAPDLYLLAASTTTNNAGRITIEGTGHLINDNTAANATGNDIAATILYAGSGTITLGAGARIDGGLDNIALVSDLGPIITGSTSSVTTQGKLILSAASTDGGLRGDTAFALPQAVGANYLLDFAAPASGVENISIGGTSGYAVSQATLSLFGQAVGDLQIGLAGSSAAMTVATGETDASGHLSLYAASVSLPAGASLVGSSGITVTAGNLLLGGTLKAAGEIDLVGPVTVSGTAATIVTTGAQGNVDFLGPIEGASPGSGVLSIQASGLVQEPDQIGNIAALAGLDITAATITLARNTVTTGNQSYSGAIALAADSTVTASAGTIGIAGTLNGADALTISAQTLDLGGTIGAATPLTALTLQLGTGGIVLTANSGLHTTGAMDLGGTITGPFALTLGGPLVLLSDTSISTASVRFLGTVDGSTAGQQSLGLTATGAVEFDGAVGGNVALDNFTLTAGSVTGILPSFGAIGTQTINPGNTSLSGAYSFTSFTDTGALTLAGDTTLNAGTLTLGGTVDGAHALTLGGGTVSLAGTMGASTPLTSLAINGTNGILLAGDASLDAGTISLGAVDGAHVLTLNGTGLVSLTQGVGTQAALAGLTVTGGSMLLGGSVDTTGSQSYLGPVTLAADSTLTTSMGAIHVSGTIDGTNVGAQSLTLNAPAGDVELDAAVGGMVALHNFEVNALSAELPSIFTTGGQTINLANGALTGTYTFTTTFTATGKLLLAGDTVLTTTSGDINIGFGVSGPHALEIDDAVGTVRITGGTDAASPLSSLTISAKGIVLGGAIVTTGLQSYSGPLTLASDATLTAGGQIALNGTTDGAHTLVLAGTGGIVINGAVGGGTALTGFSASGPITATTLDVTAASISLDGATTSGEQTYNGATTLAGAYAGSSFTDTGAATLGGATTVSTTGGNIVFGGTIDGAQSLTLAATNGTVSVAGAVGGTTALAALTLGGNSDTVSLNGAVTTGQLIDTRTAGSLTVAGGLTTSAYTTTASNDVLINITGGTGPLSLSGEFDFASALNLSGRTLTLTGSTVLDTSANNSALTLGTVDGGFGLVLNAGTGVVTVGTIGAKTALSSLTINAGATSVGNVTTTGTQTYNGTTTFNGNYVGGGFLTNGADVLGGATGVTVSGGNIGFGGTLNGAQSLVLTDTNGIVSLSGAVGGTTALTSLTVTANGIVAGSVATTGAQSYSGPIIVGGTYTAKSFTTTGPVTMIANTQVNGGTGDITFGSTVQGQFNLALASSNANIFFDGTVGLANARVSLLSITGANNATVLNNSSLFVHDFVASKIGGTLTFGNHSLESDDVVTIQATSVDGRVISTSSATITATSVSGIIQGSTVNVTATGAVSEQIVADTANVSGGSFDGSVAATRGANIAASGDVSGSFAVSGGGATISGNNVSGSITSSGLAQITASQNVSADVTGGSVLIAAGQDVTGNVTATRGSIGITATNVNSNVVAQGGGQVDITASNSITGSVTGGQVNLTAPNIDEVVNAAAANINGTNVNISGTIGGTDAEVALVAGANNITQEILGATRQVASNGPGDDNGTGDDEDEDEKKKKKAKAKENGAVYDFANQYIDNMLDGKKAN